MEYFFLSSVSINRRHWFSAEQMISLLQLVIPGRNFIMLSSEKGFHIRRYCKLAEWQSTFRPDTVKTLQRLRKSASERKTHDMVFQYLF